jgi:uncharacterized protein involved in exopolysaccharide biosynthesis
MNSPDEAELSLREVVGVIGRWKWYIVLIAIGAVTVAGIAAYVLPKKFEAVVLLSPVSNTATNGLLAGLNTMASQFGGLAGLSGIAAPTDTAKAESVAVLESDALTEQYIQQNNLLPILYADEWDLNRKAWKTADHNMVPTLWKANQFFKKKIRKVTTENKSGLVSLHITWRDPNLAAEWANGLVKMANDYRRDKAIQEAERNISYLTTEAAKTDVVGVRQAVYSILQTEISKSMLARGNDEYALKVIDPAISPEKPSSPLPLYWMAGALAVSVAFSFAAAFLRAALRSS